MVAGDKMHHQVEVMGLRRDLQPRGFNHRERLHFVPRSSRVAAQPLGPIESTTSRFWHGLGIALGFVTVCHGRDQ
jgi:hypothetical protein